MQQSGSYNRAKRRDEGSNNSNKTIPTTVSAKPDVTSAIDVPKTTQENDSTVSVVKQLPKIPKTEDISNIFDKQRENLEQRGATGALGGAFGKGGSLGFGFRGTIPKLPSFKVT